MLDLKGILEKARPSKDESSVLSSTSEEILSRIKSYCSSNSISAEPMVVGSLSKGTNLSGSDIDIFVVFSKDYSRQDLERLGLKIGHECLPGSKEKYAEHPYVSGYANGIKIDIVPCFKHSADERLISSVDRTPLHTEFIRNNLTDEQKDEVRLLKLFLKSAGIYGSEVRVQGFSGYVCELLVYHLGSFTGAVEWLSTIKGKATLGDVSAIDSSSPLVIVDPTDMNRNAAAAISENSYYTAIVTSRCYLDSPDESYFILPESQGKSAYRERGTEMFLITVKKPDMVDDIIYSQALRLEKMVCNVSSDSGFKVFGTHMVVNGNIEILIEVDAQYLPAFKTHMGPPVISENALDFLKKWEKDPRTLRGPYISGDRLYVEVANENRHFPEVLISGLSRKNIGKHLNPLKDSIKISRINHGDELEILSLYYGRRVCRSHAS
jgi:tRNA nucleotidyltransferase (CCA-adding enzyme)